MNGSRDAILGRIREALRVEAPHHAHAKIATGNAPVTAPFREWLPTVGPTEADRVALFAKLSEMLKTEFLECADMTAAAVHLHRLVAENGWKKIAIHNGGLLSALIAKTDGTLETMNSDGSYDKFEMEQCDAGITECECLVAQTGSICITTRSSGGRALSVLPPHHIVIASRAQMLADLTSAYELLAQKYAGKYPSFISFITGPSRTGDIERILVLGAHGPKKLTVLLVP